MKTIIKKRNIFWNISIVSIITCLLIIPGYTLAGTPNISLDDAPPIPAYIESKEDLVDVPVIQSQSLSHPMSPTTTNVNIVELLQQLNETLLRGYLENLTSFGPRATGTEGCDQAAHYIYETFQDMGLAVRYHNYTDDRVSGSNVIWIRFNKYLYHLWSLRYCILRTGCG